MFEFLFYEKISSFGCKGKTKRRDASSDGSFFFFLTECGGCAIMNDADHRFGGAYGRKTFTKSEESV